MSICTIFFYFCLLKFVRVIKDRSWRNEAIERLEEIREKIHRLDEK
jgi:hypothetical protein